MSYKTLKSYEQATIIYDFTVEFCRLYIDKKSRTYDQMEQAARSGKQNIVEGSSNRASEKSELKLIGIARASFQELLEDYEDFLRQRNLRQWPKDDLEAREILALAYKSNKSYRTYRTYISDPALAANYAICLINQVNFLLDRQIFALEREFVKQGGYTEKLFRQRENEKKKRLKLIGLIGLIGLISPIGPIGLIRAQTPSGPQFLVSWQAQSYAPSWYSGKVFPTQGSAVEIAFELVNNDKIVDVSGYKIRWYVNDKLIKNENDGLGIKSLKTSAANYPGFDLEARIVIADYPTGALDTTIRIPTVRPEVVINAPYPDNKVSAGSNLFEALPFFFSVKNLSELLFEWSINGKRPSETGTKPQLLDLSVNPQTPTGRPVNLSVIVKNYLKELEFSSKGLQLQVR
jgi:four helix bundle suffix protein